MSCSEIASTSAILGICSAAVLVKMGRFAKLREQPLVAAFMLLQICSRYCVLGRNTTRASPLSRPRKIIDVDRPPFRKRARTASLHLASRSQISSDTQRRSGR